MSFESLVIILLLLIATLLAALLVQGWLRRGESQAIEKRVTTEVRNLFGQLEAYLSLRDRLGLHQGLPYTHQWSAAPDFLKLIVDHALAAKPRTIVECSSGLTTLVLARCCEINGEGEVFSLENGAEFAAKSRGEVERYGLGARSTVIDAPLKPVTVDGVEYQWYDFAQLPDRSIDMLVVDGPPGFIQHHSRYPALPLLFDKLADGCVVFLDDAGRPDEVELVEMWRGRLPGIEHEFVKTERGGAILQVRR